MDIMAIYDIEDWCQDWKAETGMTLEEFSKEAGLYKTGMAGNRNEYHAADRLHTRLVAAVKAGHKAEPVQPAEGPRATERQIDYIMGLIDRGAHEEGGFIAGPITRSEVAKMSKTEASQYITSLKGAY